MMAGGFLFGLVALFGGLHSEQRRRDEELEAQRAEYEEWRRERRKHCPDRDRYDEDRGRKREY
jgi:hypothetical protein